MRFKKIMIKNFGVFKEAELRFASRTNGRRNVTFVVGKNGTGKTTLANAINWCLFGKTDFSDQNSIASIAALKEIRIDDTITVEVSLELEHYNRTYFFTRSQNFRRTEDNEDGSASCKPLSKSMLFKCTSSTQTGVTETKEQKADDIEKEVDTWVKGICSPKLKPFIFFNGERIGTLARSFEQGASNKAKDTIREAVETLLGLQAFQNGVKHLNGSVAQGVSVVSSRFDAELGRLSDASKAQHPVRIEENKRKIQLIESENKEINDQIFKQEEEQRSYEEKMQLNETGAKVVEERKRIKELQAINKNHLASLFDYLRNDFKEVSLKMIAKKPVLQALEQLNGQTLNQDPIPHIRVDTIDALLKRGYCLCGHEIKPGSAEEKALLQLKEIVPPNSVATSVQTFIDYCQTIYSGDGDKINELLNEADKIYELMETDRALLTRLDSLGSEFSDDADDIASRIRLYKESIKNTQKKISEYRDKLARNQQRIEDATNEIERYKRELIGEKKKDPERATLRRCRLYVDEVSTLLDNHYKENESKVLKRLDFKVKEMFKALSQRAEIPSISQDYVFTCVEPSGIPTRLSESLCFIAALSTITAIIQLGKELVREDTTVQSTIEETVPLVMDAPLSTFDNERIEAFGRQLPNLVDQLIIFIKDAEGDKVKPYMADKIGKFYEILPVDGSTTLSVIKSSEEDRHV